MNRSAPSRATVRAPRAVRGGSVDAEADRRACPPSAPTVRVPLVNALPSGTAHGMCNELANNKGRRDLFLMVQPILPDVTPCFTTKSSSSSLVFVQHISSFWRYNSSRRRLLKRAASMRHGSQNFKLGWSSWNPIAHLSSKSAYECSEKSKAVLAIFLLRNFHFFR